MVTPIPLRQEFHQEMLRKLALHLAAQPDGPAGPAGPAGPGPARGAVEAEQDESPERVNHFCDLAGDGSDEVW